MTSHAGNRVAWYRILYVQVLIAVGLGILVGALAPKAVAISLKPLGDVFINLMKMIIAPIVFCTVVHGIASIGDLQKLGRVGIKSLIYFEVVSTLALAIGLVVVNVLQPGVGITPEGQPFQLDSGAQQASAQIVEKAHAFSWQDFLLDMVPKTLIGAFVSGDILQVLVVSILVALAINSLGKRGDTIVHFIEQASQLFFAMLQIIVKAAPIGAFGAMSFTIGNYGLGTLSNLLALMVGFYTTATVFVLLVLGLIAKLSGFSILRFLYYIREELLLILGTSSSETALPGLMNKMERLGCARSTVGMVVPTGYSFNLDGTNIYMAMAAIFLAQFTNTPMPLSSQLSLLFIAMLTSKGATGVTGSGLIALAATIQAVPGIPIESLGILFGIDRFMSECRAITNFIGNGVATLVISRWEGEVSSQDLQRRLSELN